MKKLFALAIIFTLAFSGCDEGDAAEGDSGTNTDTGTGSDSGIVGTWAANYGDDNEGELKIEISAGTFLMLFREPSGLLTSYNGVWKQDGDIFTLYDGNKTEQDKELARAFFLDGKLILTLSAQYRTFGRPDTYELGRTNYKIGDTGPGGGLVFFAEGGQYKECSGELGNYNWSSADKVAKGYKGGNFSDWRLPDSGELDLMYRNLHLKGLGGFDKEYYWSSTPHDTYRCYCRNFYDGSTNYLSANDNDNQFRVRAVRSF